jgi:hypothetical protein
MRSRQGEEFETYHLTCPVCCALPGTSCIDEDYQELARVHPSRRVSITERNQRRDASGWEPPELAARHARAREARSPLFDPRLGPGATAVPEARSPRGMIDPPGGQRSAGSAVPEVATGPAGAGTSETGECPRGPLAAGDAWGWFATYLGQYPAGQAVPRQVLRDIADERSPAAENGPVPVSQAGRHRLRLEGRSTSTNSRGRRSTLRLAAYLKRLEELGLISRDTARDAIRIIDPDGLRGLGTPRTAGQGTRANNR